MPIDIPDHSEVFVDANIFVYHFSGPTEYTDSCTQFLQRIEEARLSGLTSALVLAETLHRLMIIEAATKLHIEPKQALRHVKAHPLDVKKLTEHLTIVKKSGPSALRPFLSISTTFSTAMQSRKNADSSPTMRSTLPS